MKTTVYWSPFLTNVATINAVINSYNLDNYSSNKMLNLIRFIKIIRNDLKNEIYNYKIKILLSLTFNYLSIIFFKCNTDINGKDEKIFFHVEIKSSNILLNIFFLSM